uniref:TonB-dependent receptor plug n=1 Tax=Marinomonas sp. (strain MWYL1) TaxID=400668 RepID=A6VS52_MARMS
MMNLSNAARIPAHLSVVALSIITINSMLVSSLANAEEVALDAIVVTGEKINKNIKDTTTAITVITEDQLESGETKQVKDIATQAPNVVADSFGHIAIRGVSGGGAATGGVALMTGAHARVTTVVDGSTQDWSGYNFAPTDLWDAKQVEVLRGPQSTTQGSSAIGGAIVVNTNDPTFDSEAAVRVGLERYKNGNLKYNLAAMSSGALIYDELAYRIAVDENKGEGWLNYDTSRYSKDHPNLSESENLNLRGKLLWQPKSNPKLSAKLTLNHLKNDGEHANFASNTDAGIATQTMTVADSGGAISRVQDSEENSIAADINYQLSPDITNILHISYINSDIYADGYGSANGGTTHTYDIQQTTTSLENRLVFNRKNSTLNGVIGFFTANKDSVIDATQGIINIDTDYSISTTALYGEGTYSLSPKTKATLGLRIEQEDVDKIGSFFSATKVDQNTNDTYYLPKLSLTNEVSDTTTLGASIRKGYSSSGTYINTAGEAFSFESEEVSTFELSSKSNFGNGTMLNAALFYNDYTDYQALSGFTIVNVDAAHTMGAEIEVTTWATDNLELRGSVGLLRSKIDKNNTNKGNKLSSAPETNLGFGFTQYIGDAWSFGADITYVGEYYSDLANSDTTTVGDYLITDARAQYTVGDLTISGYIKNLTDEDAVYFRADSLASVAQTRTIGISALYRM